MYEYMREMQLLAFRELEPEAYATITGRLAKLTAGEISDRVADLARRPFAALSGGQRQRALLAHGLARAGHAMADHIPLTP